MILDFTKILAVLERIATALENGASTVVADVEGAVSKKPRGRPPGSTAAAAQAAAVAAPPATSAAPAQTSAEPSAASVPTLQQVADAIIDLANNLSRDKAVAILTKYGVKKVPELKPDQFAAVLADVTAAKSPAPAAAPSAGLF